MVPQPDAGTTRWNESPRASSLERRRFIALGAGLGAALLAGCAADETADGAPTGGDDGTTAGGGDTEVGTFRLLISDQPVAIDEFDALEVSFDRARVFRAEGEEATASPSPTPTATQSPTPSTETASPSPGSPTETTTTETETASATATDADEADADDDGDQRGFSVLDLGGATVDLTQVVGDKAMGVFEGDLEAGRYVKIELYAADVNGVVDGESVEVTIPPGKLMIVKPFEVVPGETLSFVFDINVVRKGQTGEYNLLPVISESGVAGTDVDVEEVGGVGAEEGDSEPTEAEETEATEPEEAGDGGDGDEGDGPPSDAGNASGNA